MRRFLTACHRASHQGRSCPARAGLDERGIDPRPRHAVGGRRSRVSVLCRGQAPRLRASRESPRSRWNCRRPHPSPRSPTRFEQLNDDPRVTGFIVQLPLPEGIDENGILELIDPAKDADGLHPVNLGRLALAVDPREAPSIRRCPAHPTASWRCPSRARHLHARQARRRHGTWCHRGQAARLAADP